MEFQIENITKYYKKNRALFGVSVVLNNGIYGLLGPNGSGKTTFIQILMNILPSNEGIVLLDGIDIKQLGNQYYDSVGYLPQFPKLYPDFTIEAFLEYMCLLKAIPKSNQSNRIYEVLKEVNLIESRKVKIGNLSGGMRQRLGIAQAIINNPKIIILDEPTAGLDPVERIRFKELISQVAKEKIVIIATHIVSDVESLADEILLLKKGELVLKGSIASIIKRFEKEDKAPTTLEAVFLKIFSDDFKQVAG